MADAQYDVVVVGGGPGGYVCAIRAGQLGLKTACVESRGALGGTCLNVGCIPSKALLHSSEKFDEAQRELKHHGIAIDNASIDVGAMRQRKDKVVKDLTNGIAQLFKKNEVDYIEGTGTIQRQGEVKLDDGSTVTARHIVVATGSTHADVPGVAIDEEKIVSSTGALDFEAVPEHLVVVGGGYIGLEMGAVWHRLGAKVTVVEYMDRLLPAMDSDFGEAFRKFLKRRKVGMKLSTKVTGAETGGEGVKLHVEDVNKGKAETLEADKVLVAIGRKPYTAGLGLENVGIETDKRGFIPVDARFNTGVEGIHAIGDVIGGAMLAHKAEEEGHALADMLAGRQGHVNYATCPGIVYTWPEMAYVGKSEDELKAEGVSYRVGTFPMTANSRARCTGQTDGFVKILADAETDRILGAQVMGAEAGNTIHELVMAMEFAATAEDVARAFHGHPTLNEAVKEAALAVHGEAIHI